MRFARVPRVPILVTLSEGPKKHDFKNVGKGRPLLLVFGLSVKVDCRPKAARLSYPSLGLLVSLT